MVCAVKHSMNVPNRTRKHRSSGKTTERWKGKCKIIGKRTEKQKNKMNEKKKKECDLHYTTPTTEKETKTTTKKDEIMSE